MGRDALGASLRIVMDSLPHNISHVVGRSGLAGALVSDQVARRQRAREAAVARNAQPVPTEANADAIDAPVTSVDETGATTADAPRKDRLTHIDVRA